MKYPITFKSFSPFYDDRFFSSNWLGVVFAIKRKHGLLNWTPISNWNHWICMISHEPIGGLWSVQTDILLLIIFMWIGHWWSLGILSMAVDTLCYTIRSWHILLLLFAICSSLMVSHVPKTHKTVCRTQCLQKIVKLSAQHVWELRQLPPLSLDFLTCCCKCPKSIESNRCVQLVRALSST